MIEVMVVEDDPAVRDTLARYLSRGDEARIVAGVADGWEAVRVARSRQPAVCLLGHGPARAGGQPVLNLLASYAGTLVLTNEPTPTLIEAALRAGAKGCLVHGDFDAPELIRAIRAAARGQGWLSPVAASLAASVIRGHSPGTTMAVAPSREAPVHIRRYGLTARERDVLDLLCQGMSNAAIARRLVLTEKTIKNHLNHAYAKLQVASRAEAILLWVGDSGRTPRAARTA